MATTAGKMGPKRQAANNPKGAAVRPAAPPSPKAPSPGVKPRKKVKTKVKDHTKLGEEAAKKIKKIKEITVKGFPPPSPRASKKSESKTDATTHKEGLPTPASKSKKKGAEEAKEKPGSDAISILNDMASKDGVMAVGAKNLLNRGLGKFGTDLSELKERVKNAKNFLKEKILANVQENIQTIKENVQENVQAIKEKTGGSSHNSQQTPQHQPTARGSAKGPSQAEVRATFDSVPRMPDPPYERTAREYRVEPKKLKPAPNTQTPQKEISASSSSAVANTQRATPSPAPKAQSTTAVTSPTPKAP